MRVTALARCALLFPLSFSLYGQPVLETMANEMDRNFRVLREKADPAPYYLSYTITEEVTDTAAATLGTLTARHGGVNRYLDTTIRVGSRKLDNYHRVRGDRAHFTSGAPIAIDNTPLAIQRRLWLETDRTYRSAAERLINIRTNKQVKVAEEDDSDDFSVETAAVHRAPPPRHKFAGPEWESRLRRLSLEFAKFPEILSSQISVNAQTETKYMVSTEGARLEHGRGFARIVISAHAKAVDGMDLGTSDSFEAVDPSGLPPDDKIRAAILRVAEDLKGLLHAPVVEPFVGPAILSGHASGVFFHEIFGHRIEGHRQKDETEGQTFTKSVGQPVLPEFLSVLFDPTRRKIGTVDLNGWYDFDDEGVAARPVPLIENGILKTFLMSRSPIRNFAQSNGHGRRQPGQEVVSRQSNLLVESSRKVAETRLREMLVEEIRKQGKPYGFQIQRVTGGFTTTSRMGLQAFKVIPLVVYRVYPDGRPDELVRGADLVGTPLASFAKILATSDRVDVFNGYCGAESGNVPVSAASPAILVREIEIEKKAKSQDRPPLLPAPTETESSR